MSVVRHRDIPSKYWITKITKQRVKMRGKGVGGESTIALQQRRRLPRAKFVIQLCLVYGQWNCKENRTDPVRQTCIHIYIYIALVWDPPRSVQAHLCRLYRPQNFVMQGQSYRITDRSSLQIKGKSKTNSKLLKQSR